MSLCLEDPFNFEDLLIELIWCMCNLTVKKRNPSKFFQYVLTFVRLSVLIMGYVLCLASAISILTGMVFNSFFPFFLSLKTLFNKFAL